MIQGWFSLLASGGGVPSNAILFNGEPILFNGEYLTFTP
jgi:hypothetical protein